jgi:hypothetical protein
MIVKDREVSRFTGDFEIVPDGVAKLAADDDQPSAGLLADIAMIERKLDLLATETAADGAPSGSARARAVARIRQDAADKLRIRAKLRFEEPRSDTRAGADFTAAIEAIETTRLAAVAALDTSAFLIEEVWRDAQRSQVKGLLIEPSQGVPSEEQRELFVTILSTVNILQKTCLNLAAPGNRIISGLNRLQPRTPLEAPEVVLDDYLRKLARIARYGLQTGKIDLARLALVGLREGFVIQQAGRVKNDYVRRLLVVALGWAGAFAALLALAYAASAIGRYSGLGESFKVADFWPLFTSAAIGSAIGTWLSFSIRKVELSFGDLANLETDLLTPFYRVVFVVALTMCVCLFFATGMLQIQIGDLDTSVFKSSETVGPRGMISLLVGLLCGISERALAGSVSSRSETFVGSIGKQVPPS